MHWYLLSRSEGQSIRGAPQVVSETEVNSEVRTIVEVEEILGYSETQGPSPCVDLNTEGQLKLGIGQIGAGRLAPASTGNTIATTSIPRHPPLNQDNVFSSLRLI